MSADVVRTAIASGLTCYGGSKQSAGHRNWHAITPNLEVFYKAAYNAGLEAAAKHIESDDHNYALCIRTLERK